MVAFNVVAVSAQGKAISQIIHVTPETNAAVARPLAGVQVVLLDRRLKVGSPKVDVPSDIGNDGRSIFDVLSEAYERFRDRGESAPEIDDSTIATPGELDAAERDLGYGGSGLEPPEQYPGNDGALPPKTTEDPVEVEPEERVPSRGHEGSGASSGDGASRGSGRSGGMSSDVGSTTSGPGIGGFGSAGGGDSAGGSGGDDDLGDRPKRYPA